MAKTHNPFTGGRLRVEHWTNAIEQAATAARTLLTGVSAPRRVKPPYFWSDQMTYASSSLATPNRAMKPWSSTATRF